MRLVGLDHVQLALPPGGEAAARRFYADALGLREVAKPPNLAGRGGVWFEGGDGRGPRVHLRVEEEFRPARKAHPAFIVRGLRQLASPLRARGFEAAADEPSEGGRKALHERSLRNRVELLEPAAAPAGAPRQIPA